MKKAILAICKQHEAVIKNYRTYRSDMGSQVYDVLFKRKDGKEVWLADSYIVGEDGGKEYILNQVTKLIKT